MAWWEEINQVRFITRKSLQLCWQFLPGLQETFPDTSTFLTCAMSKKHTEKGGKKVLGWQEV